MLDIVTSRTTHAKDTPLDFINSLHHVKAVAESDWKQNFAENLEGTQEHFEKSNRALERTIDRMKSIIRMVRHFEDTVDEMIESDVSNEDEVIVGCSFQKCLDDVLKAMKYEFPLEHISVLRKVSRSLLPIAAHRDHLVAIIFQLLYVAREEVKRGAVVFHAEEARSENSEGEAERILSIRVKNCFPPATEESLVRLFEPFLATSDDELEKRYGMYIVKRFVEFYQGRIKVSSVAKETCLVFEFPLV